MKDRFIKLVIPTALILGGLTFMVSDPGEVGYMGAFLVGIGLAKI